MITGIVAASAVVESGGGGQGPLLQAAVVGPYGLDVVMVNLDGSTRQTIIGTGLNLDEG